MNVYTEGEIVTANVTAQGMTEGAKYRVIKSIEDLTGWGTYRTYVLAPADGDIYTGELLQIQNGHIILCNSTCGCKK